MLRSAALRVFLMVVLSSMTLFISGLAAQENAQHVQISVKDPSGTPVPNAEVTVAPAAGGESRSAISDSQGNVTFSIPAPGRYAVATRVAGFEPASVSLDVIAGNMASATISLKIAAQTASVNVTAGRGSPLEDMDVSTTTVSLQAVGGAPEQYTDQLINKIPGVYTPMEPANEVHPTAQVVSIRGMGNAYGVKTLVLLDGIPTNDGYFRTVDWSQVPKDRVQEVQVIRGGGATSLWGNLAMGGVIDIVTREPQPRDTFLNLSYGNYNTFTADGAATLFSSDSWRIGATFDRTQTDGYDLVPKQYRNPFNSTTRSQSTNGGLSVHYTPNQMFKAFARATIHNSDEDGLVWYNATNAWKKYEIQGGASLETGGGILSGYAWYNRVVFGTQNANPVNDAGGAYNFTNPINGYPYIAQIETARPRTYGGSLMFQKYWKHFRDVKLGMDFRTIPVTDHNSLFALSGANTAIYNEQGEHRFQGIFVQGTLRPFEAPLDITVGLREDFWQAANGLITGTSLVGLLNNSLPNETYNRFDPRIGIKYSFLHYFDVRGALYRNFSAPGMNQMYRSYTNGATYNNASPELVPETNKGEEAGIDYKQGGFTAGFTVFFNRIDHYIDYPTLCSSLSACASYITGTGLAGVTTVRQYLNVGSAVFKGGELIATYRLSSKVLLDLGLTRTEADLTSTIYPQTSPIGFQVGQVQPWVTTAGVLWNPQDRLTLSLRFKSWPTYWYNTSHSVINSGATVADAYGSYRLNRFFDLYASIQNLGNVTYNDQGATGTSTPASLGQPFRIDGGVRINFRP